MSTGICGGSEGDEREKMRPRRRGFERLARERRRCPQDAPVLVGSGHRLSVYRLNSSDRRKHTEARKRTEARTPAVVVLGQPDWFRATECEIPVSFALLFSRLGQLLYNYSTSTVPVSYVT
jgi:hypothetical protein